MSEATPKMRYERVERGLALLTGHDFDTCDVGLVYTIDDARLIVRAANSFDAMREAIAEYLKYDDERFSTIREAVGYYARDDGVLAANTKLRAALALAEKETP